MMETGTEWNTYTVEICVGGDWHFIAEVRGLSRAERLAEVESRDRPARVRRGEQTMTFYAQRGVSTC